MRQEVLRMERVSYQERGIRLLHDFNFSILEGEIVGLIPINNYGVDAFLRILQENPPINYGYVYYREQQVNAWSNSKHRKNRIALIQSRSCLVEGLTVAENIFVLRAGAKSRFVRTNVLRKQLAPYLEAIGIDISADTYVEELNDFERVVVDVLKAVVAGCKLIILQDISAQISASDIQKIWTLLSHYTAKGISFLYIDFHYEEMRQICNRVALMNNGTIIKTFVSKDTSLEAFRTYTESFDQKVKAQIHKRKGIDRTGTPVFEALDVEGRYLHQLCFQVMPGECVVLQDTNHRAFEELFAFLSGDAVPRSGELRLQGRHYEPSVGSEIAVIQERPTQTMLFGKLSYLDNLCFTLDHRLPEIWGSLRTREGVGRQMIPDSEDVADCNVERLTEEQKYELIYRRIQLQKPKVVFCVQPFRGADIELRMKIWDMLEQLLQQNIALVILAINLADTLSLADRLIRLHKGRPQEQLERSEFSSHITNAAWLDL